MNYLVRVLKFLNYIEFNHGNLNYIHLVNDIIKIILFTIIGFLSIIQSVMNLLSCFIL